MKVFNTTGLCNPDRHYMVDITERLEQIKVMIDAGKYFTINRSRQYGKTTTLYAVGDYLGSDYIVVQLDFQNIGNASFKTEGDFTQALSRLFMDLHEFSDLPIPGEYLDAFELINDKDTSDVRMDEIFRVFRRWCVKSDRPIVLLIDEVDSATNNQVFLDFLAQLRALYLKREKNPKDKTFQSVILAGVTDVKHIKSKIRDENQAKVNSPWNIADDFDVEMSLSAAGIKGMLDDYDNDHDIGMNTEIAAKYIYDYTSGYPFLVSKICQLIDTSKELMKKVSDKNRWTKYGIDEAVRIMLKEDNITLFESLMGKLVNYPNIKEQLYKLLMTGETIPNIPYDDNQKQMKMYGFVKVDNGKVVVANRIFETLLYDHFLGENKLGNEITQAGDYNRNIFVKDGKLDMRLILERFIQTFTQVYGKHEEKFKEKDGRELFLLYLKPIINGTGNYYIEAQTRNQTRTDVVVDYLGNQYVIELKIWRWPRYNEDGEKQISEYLDYFDLDTGYMLSFNFNKNKDIGVKRVNVGNKVLYEGVV